MNAYRLRERPEDERDHIQDAQEHTRDDMKLRQGDYDHGQAEHGVQDAIEPELFR